MIENKISYHNQYIEGSSNIVQTSSNSAVAALLQLFSYSGIFLSKFYTFHVDIYNLHLLHQTNCKNKQKQAGAELCQAQESLGLLGLDMICAFFD